jgi:hypothetical protein
MYNFDEGAFELPADWQDRSLHIFEHRDPTGGDVLTITRQPAEKGKPLAQLVSEYVDETSTRLRRFELASRTTATVGALPAILLQFSWFHAEKGTIVQQQAFIEYGDRVVFLTMTSSARTAEASVARFKALLATFKFRRA